jgi:chromosome segregation ATPase
MARTIYTTQTFVNEAVGNERSLRVTGDSGLKTSISNETSKINVLSTRVTGLQENIASETTRRNNILGDQNWDQSLLTEAGQAPANMTEAITAVSTKANNIKTEIDEASGNISSLATLSADVVTFKNDFQAQKERIEAMLQSSTADYDTFAEIVTLIQSIDAGSSDALDSYKVTNDEAIATKSSNIQTVTTDTVYVDELDADKKYRMFVSNGQLVVEDI